MEQNGPLYPVQFTVDYPDRPLDRFSSFFRLFAAIPIMIVLATVSGGQSAGGILFAAPLLMILFKQKYPRWWFDWNFALLKFENRVSAYFLLLRDEYPSTDEDQAVHLELPYPDVEADLNRWLPLFKWLLAVPHYAILFLLGIVAFFAAVIAWFAILFTSSYPMGLFNYVVGVMRYSNRVTAYAFLLVTDRYPPFRLGP